MELSSKGAAFIRRHEGFRAKAYRDPVGILTIGIGFTWRSKAFKMWWRKNKITLFGVGSKMTKIEAEDCLRYLVNNEYGAAVNKITTNRTPQHVFDAACSMVYNCGLGALRWRWGKAYAKGQYIHSAELLQTTATTAKGPDGKRVKLRGLVTRRREEAILMRSGKYTGHKSVGGSKGGQGGQNMSENPIKTTPPVKPEISTPQRPKRKLGPWAFIFAAVASAALYFRETIPSWNTIMEFIGL